VVDRFAEEGNRAKALSSASFSAPAGRRSFGFDVEPQQRFGIAGRTLNHQSLNWTVVPSRSSTWPWLYLRASSFIMACFVLDLEIHFAAG
jgi:hypothetical protein